MINESNLKFIIFYTTIALAILIIIAGLVYSWMLGIPDPASPLTNYAVYPTPTPVLPGISCYYFDPVNSLLVKEKKEVHLPPLLEDKVRVSVESLFEGPQTKRLTPLWVDTTKVRGVFYLKKEKQIVIDLSFDFESESFGHSLIEWAALYSLVDTIKDVNPQSIKSVQILQYGKAIDFTGSHWVWKGTIYPDYTWVSSK